MGKIGRAHGLKGELRFHLAPDWREMPKSLSEVRVKTSQDERELAVVSVRIQSEKVFLKLRSIDDRNAAEVIKGALCYIKKCDRPVQDGFYDDELAGMAVKTIGQAHVGIVKEIMHMPGQDIMVVQDKQKEYLIPCVEQFVVDVDIDSNTITIDPIEGLLE